MIYVDTLTKTKPTADWPYANGCHLTADSDEELHAFAVEKLGLQREWVRNVAWCVHYQLTASKRALAIAQGAEEMTPQRAVALFRESQPSESQAASARTIRSGNSNTSSSAPTWNAPQ